MPTERDMSEPVTRGEMHEALEIWAGAIIDRMTSTMTAVLDERFAKIDERFAKIDERFAEIPAFIAGSAGDVIRHVEVMLDPHRTLPARVGALEDERLPDRVARLEAKVIAPKRRARSRKRPAP